MELVDMGGAFAITGLVLFLVVFLWVALTKRYSNFHVLLLVLAVLSLLAGVWFAAAGGWWRA
jgi:asparagine N-glycosylation enzyme membrane subunit Stt3